MLSVRHLPTWLLILGYPIYWLEITFRPAAHSTPVASVLFLGFMAYILWKASPINSIREFFSEHRHPWAIGAVLLGGAILFLSFVQACLPLHLNQEYDAIHYHYSLPRQHLILGSFAHLPWSSADLWPMPIQFALSPYWFVSSLPNKFPQFLFLLGLLAISWNLAKRFASRKPFALLVPLMILGSHGFSIQFGTAMLDLVTTYLFLAALDSFLEGNQLLAALELNFWFWSKSFIPIQAILILVGLAAVMLFSRRDAILKQYVSRRFCLWVTLTAVLVGGPFVFKGLKYVGTPLPPFKVFALGGTLAADSDVKHAVEDSTRKLITARDAYGDGRSLKSLAMHFWKIAVPSHGVNNAFDYPVGLPYLLALGPFVFLFFRSLRGRYSSITLWMVVFFWGTWWLGSQQTRWFYIPLVLMFLVVITQEAVAASLWIRAGVLISLALTGISLSRAYAGDIKNLPAFELRPVDRSMVEHTRQWPPGTEMVTGIKEVAFAECPVRVEGVVSEWILPVPNRGIIPN